MSEAFRTPFEGSRVPVLRPYTDSVAKDLIEKADQQIESMKETRASDFDHWLEISQWIDPRRGQWLWTDTKTRGKLHGRIINNVAFRSSKVGAAGMHSGLTSRSRPWFMLTTGDPEVRKRPNAKSWLRMVESLFREILDRSNFYGVARINYRELFNFGHGAFSMLRDFEEVVHFRQHTIGSYYLANNWRGQIDAFAEEYVLTVGQIVERFDFDRLSRQIQDQAERKQWNKTHKVRRLVQVNRGENYRPGEVGWRGDPFMVMDWIPGDPKNDIVGLRGEPEFPVIAPRWEPLTDHPYAATWPGSEALADQKQVQTEEIGLAHSKAHINDPATVAPTSLQGKMGRIRPGQRIFVNELQGQGQVRRAIEREVQLGDQRLDIDRIADRVEKAYHQDVFQAITRLDQSATRVIEIDARIREQMSQLGPIVESLSDDQNDPMLTRLFGMCERAGLIPEPPEELVGVPIKIDYISILANAQRGADIDKLDRWLESAIAVQQADPRAGFRFDGDQWMVEKADQLGVPAKVVRSDEEVEALVAQAAQREAAAEQTALAGEAARAARDASQANVGGQNALELIAGGAGQ